MEIIKPSLWKEDHYRAYYVPNTNIVDVGGNIGTSALLFNNIISQNNKIYSFEPIFHYIEKLNILNNDLEDKIQC